MNAKELKDKIRELDLQEDFRSFVHEDFDAPFMVGDVELQCDHFFYQNRELKLTTPVWQTS